MTAVSQIQTKQLTQTDEVNKPPNDESILIVATTPTMTTKPPLVHDDARDDSTHQLRTRRDYPSTISTASF